MKACPYCGYNSGVTIYGVPWHPMCYEEVRLRRETDKAGVIVTEAHIEALRSGKGRSLPDEWRSPTYASLADLTRY